MTLGERLRKNGEEANKIRLKENLERRNRLREGVELLLGRVRTSIEDTINSGRVPYPISLDETIFADGHWGSRLPAVPVSDPSHPAHDIYRRVLGEWADQEGLSITIQREMYNNVGCWRVHVEVRE